MVGVYFILETLCDNSHRDDVDPKESDFNTTMVSPTGDVNIDMDNFGVTSLGEDDALRLRYMTFLCEDGMNFLGMKDCPPILFRSFFHLIIPLFCQFFKLFPSIMISHNFP